MFYGDERTLTPEEIQRLKVDFEEGNGQHSDFDGYCLCLTIEFLQQENEEKDKVLEQAKEILVNRKCQTVIDKCSICSICPTIEAIDKLEVKK